MIVVRATLELRGDYIFVLSLVEEEKWKKLMEYFKIFYPEGKRGEFTFFPEGQDYSMSLDKLLKNLKIFDQKGDLDAFQRFFENKTYSGEIDLVGEIESWIEYDSEDQYQKQFEDVYAKLAEMNIESECFGLSDDDEWLLTPTKIVVKEVVTPSEHNTYLPDELSYRIIGASDDGKTLRPATKEEISSVKGLKYIK